MFNRLLIAVLTLGLLLTFGSAAFSFDDAPKHGLTQMDKVNPSAARFQDLAVIERELPPFQKPANEILQLATPTTVLPPAYFCDFIDYSGGSASYFWLIPDIYGDQEMGMRFTPAEEYNCTLLTAYIGVYGTYLGGNPAGTPDMKVTVYADDGFGYPGTSLGSVVVPFASLPTSGLAYVPVDLTALGPLVFVDGEEFHVGVSVDGFADGDTLAILSDDGSNGLQRSWDHWAAGYFLMVDDWGIDVNFLIGVDICCDRIPYTECYTQEYDCGAAYYWPQPDAYGDDYFNMRFSVEGPETLMSVGVALYGPVTTGTPDLDVFVWGSDGFGFPDLGNVIYSTTIPNASLQYFPNYNVVDLSGMNIVLRDEFHVGWSTNGGPGDTLAGLSDDGSCGTLRSSEYWSGIWGTILGDWGVDVNFLIYADLCKDEFSDCRTLFDYCNIYYIWSLPDRYGTIGDYQKFSPVGQGCRLEKLRIALYWPSFAAGWPLYTYNSEVQVYGADIVTGLPDPGNKLAGITITPAEYVLFPGWTEVDFTTALPDPLLFDGDIWGGIESFAPDTLSGIFTVSDDGSCGSYRSAENWTGLFGYMADNWGIDVNFVMEADVCCVPVPGVTCVPGEDWPTAGKNFARLNRSLSSLGDAQGTLTKAWEYENPQVAAYNSPVVYNDTIVCYFLNNVVALDLNTGGLIWARPSDGFQIGGGAFVTPTIFNFDSYGVSLTLVFVAGGDTKAFTAIDLATGATVWTNDFMFHNLHFMTWGTSVIQDHGGVPIIYYNDDDGDIYAVNALTGGLFTGWVVNPVNVGGAVLRGVTSDGTNLYLGVSNNITEGDVVCVDGATGTELWRLSTSGGLQLPILLPDMYAAGATEAFDGMIAYEDVEGQGPTLFTGSVYDPGFLTPPYLAGGIIYSINATDGSLNWANVGIGHDYQGLNIDGDQVINCGWTPWVPGYGDYRGPISYNKGNGSILWSNTTTNPGLGDFWLMDAVMSCESYDQAGDPDWITVLSRNNFLGFYRSTDGAMMFHRRFIGLGDVRAGHRVGTIMTDGALLATWRWKMVCLVNDVERPRLDIPDYTVEVPSEADPPNTLKYFENVIGNLGGAPLTIDSVRLTDTDNNTSPPPSASISIVDLDRATEMEVIANKFAGNAAAFREALGDDADKLTMATSQSNRNHAAYVIPAFINNLVAPVDGTVIPPQGAYNDSSAYIDIVVDIDGPNVPRGYHPFYAHVYSDDPDYFLDSARIDESEYAVPQIQLAIVGGCLYADVVMDFGVGAANFWHVWNATKIADGDITSVEIDGDGASFWQGAYIFGTAKTGTNTPPGKPALFSPRVAHYAANWSAAAPANWESILADPNCFDVTCPPNHRTNVLLGTISNDMGVSYDDVYGEVVVYAFVDSVQNMCEYDTLGNCIAWNWEYANADNFGVQPPFDDTLTMGFHACASVIGAYDEPLLNNFVIHRFDFGGRYGPVDDVYMGAMLDYDVVPNNAANWAGFDASHSLAFMYGSTNDNGWGMVKIPWGDGYDPMINAKTLDNDQAAHNDTAVWLDSAYYWMSSLTGLSHQQGAAPPAVDDFDREAFFTLAELDMPAAPDVATLGVAVFGLPALATAADDPASYHDLAVLANQWCGFGRGDVNNDGAKNIVDIAYLIDFVYYGGNGPYPFAHLGDVNCDDATNSLDVLAMIQYYFYGGPTPCGEWTLAGY